MPVRQDKKGRWHAEVCIDGQRIHRILPPGAGKKDAEGKEDELRQSLKTYAYTEDPWLVDIMSLYMKHAEGLRSNTAFDHAVRIGKYLDGKRVSDVLKVAAVARNDMLKTYKPATVNRSIGTLKKALTIAYEAEIIASNPGALIKRLPENNMREVFLSIPEVKMIADQASEQVRAAIWIALYTGMRRGEILKLQKNHIGPDMITIPSANTKTLRLRSVPIINPLVKWLEYVPIQLNFEGLKTGWQRARVKAGMDHVNFHDLRHSTASLLAQNGVSLQTISKILGHSTTRMSERYAHIKVDQQRDALKKVFE